MLEIKIEKTREYGRQKVQTPIDRRKMLVATSRITECKTRVPKPISHCQDIFLVKFSQKSTITRIPLLSLELAICWHAFSFFSLSLSFLFCWMKIKDRRCNRNLYIYSLCTIKFILRLKIWSKIYANYNEFLEKIFFKRFFWWIKNYLDCF